MEVRVIKPNGVFQKARYELLCDQLVLGIKIPKGYVTDGATSPRLAWPLIPPISNYLEATVLHDYLLSLGVNRYRADKVFKRAAKYHGVEAWVSSLMFYSVVCYGFIKQPKDYLI